MPLPEPVRRDVHQVVRALPVHLDEVVLYPQAFDFDVPGD